jgi:hypothetical protein
LRGCVVGRLRLMRYAHSSGFRTGVSVEPMLEGNLVRGFVHGQGSSSPHRTPQRSSGYTKRTRTTRRSSSRTASRRPSGGRNAKRRVLISEDVGKRGDWLIANPAWRNVALTLTQENRNISAIRFQRGLGFAFGWIEGLFWLRLLAVGRGLLLCQGFNLLSSNKSTVRSAEYFC